MSKLVELIGSLVICFCCILVMTSGSILGFYTCTNGHNEISAFDRNECFDLDVSPTAEGPSEYAEDEVYDFNEFPAQIEGLSGRYKWNNYDEEFDLWEDMSGENNDVDIKGGKVFTLDEENKMRIGTKDTWMRFPSACIGANGNYTLAFVAKYHGDSRGRVFDGSDVNWLAGFYGGISGHSHHGSGGWLNYEKSKQGDALFCMVDQKNLVRVNGVDYTNVGYTNGQTPTQFTINAGIAKANNWSGDGEVSDFAVSEILIYNRDLTVGEMKKVEKYLMREYLPNKLQRGTRVAKGSLREKTGVDVKDIPNWELSGTQAVCQKIAKEKGYKAWGHRNFKHSSMPNTCFFYDESQVWDTYADDELDDVHTVGCVDPRKDVRKGC